MKKITITTAAILSAFAVQAFAADLVAPKVKAELYGFIQADTMYDDHGTKTDEYLWYTDSGSTNNKNFRMTAKYTRLGVNLKDEANKVDGKVEIDFAGALDAQNKAIAPRLRHAYITTSIDKFDFLAGQTWHLAVNQVPDMANASVLGYSGALYNRVPQLRATYNFTDTLTFAMAATRPSTVMTDCDGTNSGMPGIQGLISQKLGKGVISLGMAYEQWDNATRQSADTNLLALNFSYPINGIFSVNGQLWTGRNLADFLGGIGNTTDIYTNGGVRAQGGFVDFKIKPQSNYYFNLIAGTDQPKYGDVSAGATSKTGNTTYLANANYVFRSIITTLECAYNVTDYKLTTGDEQHKDMHYQLSFKYNF